VRWTIAEPGDQKGAVQEGLTVDYIQGMSLSPGVKVYVIGEQLFVDGSLSDLRHPMTVLFADYIHSLMLRVIPDTPKPQPLVQGDQGDARDQMPSESYLGRSWE
jgi:hypothetical protein